MTTRSTGWIASKDNYAVPVMFNPYTGEPRDVRDVQSDPQGILIVPPGKVEMLAVAPTPPAQAADSVLKDAARWQMAVLVGNEVMLHPDKRSNPSAVKAYMDAVHSGLDLTGAVDAARKQGANNDNP